MRSTKTPGSLPALSDPAPRRPRPTQGRSQTAVQLRQNPRSARGPRPSRRTLLAPLRWRAQLQ
eukprot:3592485-Lingulodinium_polyedra.AAC.1